MDEIFTDEFVTWRHKTPIGVKVDEIFGMDRKSGKIWLELAKQIFGEQGESDFRVIGHFSNGAPFLEGYTGRISVTHTDHFLCVAFLPKTPDTDLETFNPRTAMGIDAERLDREQVLKIRDKFLSEEEKKLIPSDDIQANIIAWTSKEAVYKAALTPGLEFSKNISIIRLPQLDLYPEKKSNITLGEVKLTFPEETGLAPIDMKLYSYVSYGCCVTIAVSPKCARFNS